jgi:hypothetical protein
MGRSLVGFPSRPERVLAVRDKAGSPCVGVRALVGDRLEQLNQRIEELLALRDDARRRLGRAIGEYT